MKAALGSARCILRAEIRVGQSRAPTGARPQDRRAGATGLPLCQTLEVRAQLIDVGLYLRHPGHLDLELAINAIDLHLHHLEEFSALGRLLPGRARRADATLRSSRS